MTAEGFHRFHIPCGPEVVFRPSPGCGLVSVYAFIMAGLRDETPETNGISHLCEHMVFNGTAGIPQKELYNRITSIGALFNAVTRRDYSCYLFTVPRENLLDALFIQREMLFSSAMAPQQVEKEKFIITEEIAQEEILDHHLPTRLFHENIFTDPLYRKNITGSRDSLGKISRDDLLHFYIKHYRPENTRFLIFGDIEPSLVKKYMTEFYPPGGEVHKTHNTRPDLIIRPSAPGFNLWDNPPIITRKCRAGSSYVHLALQAPGTDHPLFLPFNIFSEIIYTGGESGLENKMKESLGPSFRSFSVTYHFWKDSGLLLFRTLTDPQYPPEKTLDIMTKNLDGVLKRCIPQSDLNEFLISEEANRLYGMEKINIYGFWDAQAFINMDHELFTRFPEKARNVTAAHIEKAVSSVFKNARWFAMASGPELEDGNEILLKLKNVKEIRNLEAGIERREIDDSEKYAVNPEEPHGNKRITKSKIDPVTRVSTLPGGMKLIVENRPCSEITAFCLLARDRCLHEPPGKNGVAELLARLMGESCGNLSRNEFTALLNSMGAILKTAESLPAMDDPYYLGQYSCIRLEVIPGFFDKALDLLGEMIHNPRLDKESLEMHRGVLAAELARREVCSSTPAQKIFYRKLTGGHRFSQSPMGNIDNIDRINGSDLESLHESLFAAENLLLVVESPFEPERVIGRVKAALCGGNDGMTEEKNPPPFGSFTPGRFRLSPGFSPAAVMAGFPLSPDSGDEAALLAAMQILTAHLSFQLREKMGYSYRINGGLEKTRYGSFARFYLETGNINAPRAADMLESLLFNFRGEHICLDDVKRMAANYRGRSLISRLSSINRAFLLGMDSLLGDPLNHRLELIKEMEKLTPYRVRDVVKKYLSPGEILTALID